MKTASAHSAISLLAVLIAGTFLWGCSPSGQVTQDAAARDQGRDTASGAAHDMALQHFIDGSLYELKGEHAQAILEYQDALRFEKNAAMYFALAKNYSQLGKHSLAIEAGRAAVHLSPDNLIYRQTLAEVFAGAFEIDSAAAQYEEIIKRDSSDIGAWYNLARLYQARQPLKALALYQRILDRFGNEWEILLRLADLYNTMNQFDKAAGALQRMITLDPGNEELKRSTAQTFVRAQEYDQALLLYNDLHDLKPGNLDYVGEMAAAYLMKREYRTADSLFQMILERDSVRLETKLHIGEIYFGQIEKDSSVLPTAQATFERIAASYPSDWRAYWFLGAIGAIARNDSMALKNFRKVTELASWNADGWVYLSSVFLEKNKFQEVATVLESARQVLPDDFRVNFYLGVAYSRLGRNVDAARVLERARGLNPTDVGAMSQLALVYDGMKRYEDSDRLYEEALKIEPDNHVILNNYAYSLSERGVQLDRALSMSTKAVEAQPDNSSYLDTIGWIHYRLGRLAEAEKNVKKAIENGEVSAVVYEHLGDIYYAMNDKERALEHWKIALKLDENNAALRAKLSRGSL